MGYQIHYFKVADIKPYDRNPRDNSKAVDKVAASIEEFGFNVPVLIDTHQVLVAGHTRLEAAKKLGLETIPCIVLDGLDPELIKQYRIIDNKTGELSSWDYEKLMLELEAITEIDMSLFEFGDFSEVEEEAAPDFNSNLDHGSEIDLGEFDDDTFEHECPYCGFRWNDYV